MADEKKGVKARVLEAVVIAGNAHNPNDVVMVDAATFKTYSDSLDSDPAAVKYAESLKRDSAEN